MASFAACTTEEVVMVAVASVQIVPGTVRAVEGERVQLSATVLDDRNQQLSPRGVEWRSDDPRIASVDERGLVTAHSEGSATVRASFEGVSGATDVRVLRGPFVELARSSVGLYAGPGASPEPEVIAIANGGAGDLTGLAASVVYEDGDADGWLRAELSGTSVPSQLTLSAERGSLGPGMHEAEVRIGSSSASPPGVVRVTLSIAGFEVRETDGATAVGEGGGTDRLSVVLSARPSSAVRLNVASSDPGEVRVSPSSLRFTPSDWSSPQTVTVRGVDDGEDDGDESVRVLVSVDVGESHEAFEGLDDETVTVVNRDDDDPVPPGLVVQETDGDTRVRESGTYDSLRVRLAAAPASNVVLSVSSANPSEVAIASSSTITFTPGNWNVVQHVVVRGVDDLRDDGDRNVVVTLAVVGPASADAYDGRSARVTVRNEDNDRGGGGGGGGGGDDDDDDDEDDDSGPGGGGRGGGGGGRGGGGGGGGRGGGGGGRGGG